MKLNKNTINIVVATVGSLLVGTGMGYAIGKPKSETEKVEPVKDQKKPVLVEAKKKNK